MAVGADPATISFDHQLFEADLDRACQAAGASDLLLADVVVHASISEVLPAIVGE